jgi:hypothetical protein
MTSAAIIFCATTVAGCAGFGEKPYTAHANLEMYDKPRRARVAPKVDKVLVEPIARQMPSADSAQTTIGLASTGPTDIWAARERARQEDLARDQREIERLKGVLQICRAC